jgi:hypothetical protein
LADVRRKLDQAGKELDILASWASSGALHGPRGAGKLPGRGDSIPVKAGRQILHFADGFSDAPEVVTPAVGRILEVNGQQGHGLESESPLVWLAVSGRMD